MSQPAAAAASAAAASVAAAAAPAKPAEQPRVDSDDDDDAPALSEEMLALLSPEARAALAAHRASAKAAEAALAKAAADGSTEIGEDFGMSQFWYTDECADEMALAAIEAARRSNPSASAEHPLRIVCISAPSAFKALKRLNAPDVRAFVLEYDRRFAAYGPDFVFYDFNHPAQLVSAFSEAETGGPLRRSFDAVIADPPYLNEDCMTMTGETIRLLAKTSNTPTMFNTGAILRKPIDLVLSCYPCVKRPRHRVHLMNEFVTFTNWECERLGGWEK